MVKEKNTFVHLEESEVNAEYQKMKCDMQLLSDRYKISENLTFKQLALNFKERKTVDAVVLTSRSRMSRLSSISNGVAIILVGIIEYAYLCRLVQFHFYYMHPAIRAQLLQDMWFYVLDGSPDVWTNTTECMTVRQSVYFQVE